MGERSKSLNLAMPDLGNLVRYGGTYLIQNYLEEKMSASSVLDFNDPFELHHRPGRLPTKEEEQARIRTVAKRNKEEFEAKILLQGGKLKRAKRKVNKAMAQKKKNPFASTTPALIESQRERAPRIFDAATKVICCASSENPHPGEIPMWGYYADCHRGIRIHYTPAFYMRDGILATPMDYEDDPVEFGFPETTEVGMEAYVKKMLRRKATSWNHEAEVRLFVPVHLLTLADDGTGRNTKRWWLPTARHHVARIDLGIRCNDPKSVDRLKAEAPDIKIYQTKRNANSYLCQYERIH